MQTAWRSVPGGVELHTGLRYIFCYVVPGDPVGRSSPNYFGRKMKGWLKKKQTDRKFKKAGTGIRAVPYPRSSHPCRQEEAVDPRPSQTSLESPARNRANDERDCMGHPAFSEFARGRAWGWPMQGGEGGVRVRRAICFPLVLPAQLAVTKSGFIEFQGIRESREQRYRCGGRCACGARPRLEPIRTGGAAA